MRVRPGRRGVGGRDHPQADVRAAAALRVRRGRPVDGQPERLLRARDPARDAAWSTVLLFQDGFRLPFDVNPLRALPYHLGRDGRPAPVHVDADRAALTGKLRHAAPRNGQPGVPAAHRPHTAGRERARRHRAVPRAGRGGDGAAEPARRRSPGARPRRPPCGAGGPRRPGPHQVRAGDRPPEVVSRGRGARRRGGPRRRHARGPPPRSAGSRVPRLRAQPSGPTTRGRGHPAPADQERGPDSETYGLLGRVYKDQWDQAVHDGRHSGPPRACSTRRSRRTCRVRGRLARPLPGHQRGAADAPARPGDPRIAELLPVVRYALDTRRSGTRPTSGTTPPWSSWPCSPRTRTRRRPAVTHAFDARPQPWQARSPLDTLVRLRRARERTEPSPDWVHDVEAELAGVANAPSADAR